MLGNGGSDGAAVLSSSLGAGLLVSGDSAGGVSVEEGACSLTLSGATVGVASDGCGSLVSTGGTKP